MQTPPGVKRPSRSMTAYLLATLVISLVYLAGVASVPFHPDESTFLYLSGDFERLLSSPSSMAWQPDLEGDPVQRYRTLDAPLGRYWVGFGRWLTGQPPLPVDWDWGASWQQNDAAGALPAQRLLLAGRYPMAALMPISMLLLFFTGRRMAGDFTGWTAGLLLASNALVLMLSRRAVSESLVIFTTSLTLFSLAYAPKRPWLTALPAALAFCAKHSLGALAPVGLLAVFWQAGVPLPARLRQAGLYAALYLAVVLALNPFVWQHPLDALRSAAAARSTLAENQAADRPEQVLNTPGRRLLGMAGGLFLTQPILAEVGNYLEDTRQADEAYLANPLHRLLRSLAAGGLLMALTIFGWLAGLRRVLAGLRRALPGGRTPQAPNRRLMALLLAASALQALALLALVPLPFQRYYLPLVPHACLWAAFGLYRLILPFQHAARNRLRRLRADS